MDVSHELWKASLTEPMSENLLAKILLALDELASLRARLKMAQSIPEKSFVENINTMLAELRAENKRLTEEIEANQKFVNHLLEVMKVDRRGMYTGEHILCAARDIRIQRDDALRDLEMLT